MGTDSWASWCGGLEKFFKSIGIVKLGYSKQKLCSCKPNNRHVHVQNSQMGLSALSALCRQLACLSLECFLLVLLETTG